MIIEADNFPHVWAEHVNGGRVDEVIALYNERAILMPTFSPRVIRTREALQDYFTQLASRDGLEVNLHEGTVHSLRAGESGYVINGIYDFRFKVEGTLLTFPSRFSFVIDTSEARPILHHHSSQVPRTLT